MKGKKFQVKRILHARLSFDEGFAEKPIYSIKGKTTEKIKGINMIKLIEDNFAISIEDVEEEKKENIKEMVREIGKLSREPIKWNRDEQGNIQSPFRSRKWGGD